MGHKSIRPDRATVERIFAEVAKEAGVTSTDLLAAQRRGKPGKVSPLTAWRAAAMDRIAAETGCSICAVADAVGFDRSGVCRAVRKLRAERAAGQDAQVAA